MSNIGQTRRRGALPTPAAATVVGAAIGLGLLLVAPTATAAAPATSAETRSEPVAVSEEEADASITGVVVGADGRRYLGAIVQLHQAGTGAGSDGEPGPYLRPAYTGVDGRYRFDGLDPGCYHIIVDAPAGTTFDDDAETESHLACVGADDVTAELRSVTGPEPGADVDPDSPRSSAGSGGQPTRTIEIVHLGHHLGQLEPSTIELELAGATVETEIGGWPRVVTAIEAARPIDAPESTITVNTGGVLAGSTLAHLFGGAADAAMLNQACFDYLAPSPQDQARAAEWASFVRFLSGNPCQTTVLDAGGVPRPGSASTDPAVAIRAVGAGTVGFVAVAPGRGPTTDPLAATEARVRELAAGGTSTIVVLSGLGLAADRELAGRLPAVDAIVGSGPGSLLGRLDDLGLATGGPYPDRERNAEGDPVCLGHSGHRARAVGVLEIELDASGRVVDCGGAITLLVGRRLVVAEAPATDEDEDSDGGADGAGGTDGTDDSAPSGPRPSAAAVDRVVADHPALAVVAPDLATSRALDRWTGIGDILLDDPVATVTEHLCRTRVPGRSVGLLCQANGLVSDTTAPRPDAQRLVAEAFRHRAAQLGQATIALIDSETVVGAIEAGPLTTVEAYRLLPTGPTLAVIDLTGEELAAVIGERIGAAIDGSPGAYPHASGLRFAPDLSHLDRPVVGPIEVVDENGAVRPLDPDATYRVVVTDRLLADGEASPTLGAAGADGRARQTTIGTAEALLDYVDDVLGRTIEPPELPAAALGAE